MAWHIAGSNYSLSGAAGETVTIPGNQITGNVTITVTKTVIPANGKTISITGQDVKFEDGTTNKVVSPGTVLTLTLTPEAGYKYSVQMDGREVMNNSTITYQLTVGDSDVSFTVTKTLDTTDKVAVSEYLSLNSTKMWLITFKTTLADGKAATYEGKTMYYSTKYDAYCYLVIAENLDVDTASAKLNVTSETAVNIRYDGDVNRTGKLDAADAQFVANMYNTMYSDFDEVTMDKFLSADMNGDKNVNVNDAVTIINQILGIPG